MWATIYQNEIHKCLDPFLVKDLVSIVLACFDTFESALAPFQQRAFDACCVTRANVFITGKFHTQCNT